MTKFPIALMLCFCSLAGKAQSLDDINKMMADKKFAEAKAGIDKLMSDPKNVAKADPWYYKGRVYNSLSYETTTPPADAYSYKLTAFDAFKKNQELDKNDIRLKFEGYRSYLDIYLGLYDLGAKFYNNKDYKNAFMAFTKALEVKDFLMGKNYTFTEVKLNALDTSLVLNAAIAASQDKNTADAVKYYRVLTDANVSDKNFKEVYEFLADHYAKAGDAANMNAIVEKGKKFYPENEYWTDLEMETVRETGDKAALFAKYEDLIAKNPTSFVLPYNYSIDQFNNIYAKDAKPENIEAAREKLTTTLKSAITNDKGIDASVLMTKHLYNLSSDLSIATNLVKGTKPEDVKKKAALQAETIKKMDEFLSYGQQVAAYFDAQPSLKPVQKATYQELLSNMSEVYNYKKQPAKAAEMDKKRSTL